MLTFWGNTNQKQTEVKKKALKLLPGWHSDYIFAHLLSYEIIPWCFSDLFLLQLSLLPFSIRDFDSLNEEDQAENLQLAFDISEREFGIRPFTSAKELSDDQELDKTKMITYLSKFYELFRGTPLPASGGLLYSNILCCTFSLFNSTVL